MGLSFARRGNPLQVQLHVQILHERDDCPYAHRAPTAAEIVKFGFTKPAATDGGKGMSKGDKAKLPCFKYAKGTCELGSDCFFLHAKENKPKAKAKATAEH